MYKLSQFIFFRVLFFYSNNFDYFSHYHKLITCMVDKILLYSTHCREMHNILLLCQWVLLRMVLITCKFMLCGAWSGHRQLYRFPNQGFLASRVDRHAAGLNERPVKKTVEASWMVKDILAQWGKRSSVALDAVSVAMTKCSWVEVNRHGAPFYP